MNTEEDVSLVQLIDSQISYWNPNCDNVSSILEPSWVCFPAFYHVLVCVFKSPTAATKYLLFAANSWA